MNETTTSFTSRDGIEITTYRWAPDGPARAVIQVQHGLAEHAARYRRFAEGLTDAGYLVYAPDARGSGDTADGAFGSWGPDGWPGWVNDVGRLSALIRQENPGLRLGLFGHSLGSFAVQHHLLEHSGDVDAVVLSGSTEVSWLIPVLDADEPADLSAFNEPFEDRTGFEWLSRDTDEVDAYVADPACGWEAPPIPGIGSLAAAADPERIAAIRDDLPILIVSGTDDPLAQGGAAVDVLASRYRDAGLRDVEVHLYPGARHEVLNETNRDEITADIIAFLDRTTGSWLCEPRVEGLPTTRGDADDAGTHRTRQTAAPARGRLRSRALGAGGAGCRSPAAPRPAIRNASTPVSAASRTCPLTSPAAR